MEREVQEVEKNVARVIRTEPATRTRAQILEGASRALAGLTAALPPEEVRERLAFLALCLTEVQRSLDQTVEAWEKRGYWVKADRFRAEWRWVEDAISRVAPALGSGDLREALEATRQLAGRLPPARQPQGKGKDPIWAGSWQRWLSAADRG
jgi:hypothetical protein